MAKKRSTVVIRLVSQAGTGFFYTLRKAVRANAEKLQLMKHDPRVNAHVLLRRKDKEEVSPDEAPFTQLVAPFQVPTAPYNQEGSSIARVVCSMGSQWKRCGLVLMDSSTLAVEPYMQHARLSITSHTHMHA